MGRRVTNTVSDPKTASRERTTTVFRVRVEYTKRVRDTYGSSGFLRRSSYRKTPGVLREFVIAVLSLSRVIRPCFGVVERETKRRHREGPEVTRT